MTNLKFLNYVIINANVIIINLVFIVDFEIRTFNTFMNWSYFKISLEVMNPNPNELVLMTQMLNCHYLQFHLYVPIMMQ